MKSLQKQLQEVKKEMELELQVRALETGQMPERKRVNERAQIQISHPWQQDASAHVTRPGIHFWYK